MVSSFILDLDQSARAEDVKCQQGPRSLNWGSFQEISTFYRQEVQLDWHLLTFSHVNIIHTCTHIHRPTHTHTCYFSLLKCTCLRQPNHTMQLLFFPEGDNCKSHPAALVGDDKIDLQCPIERNVLKLHLNIQKIQKQIKI